MADLNKPETDAEIEAADTRAETLRRYQATLAARPRPSPTPSSPPSQSSTPATTASPSSDKASTLDDLMQQMSKLPGLPCAPDAGPDDTAQDRLPPPSAK